MTRTMLVRLRRRCHALRCRLSTAASPSRRVFPRGTSASRLRGRAPGSCCCGSFAIVRMTLFSSGPAEDVFGAGLRQPDQIRVALAEEHSFEPLSGRCGEAVEEAASLMPRGRFVLLVLFHVFEALLQSRDEQRSVELREAHDFVELPPVAVSDQRDFHRLPVEVASLEGGLTGGGRPTDLDIADRDVLRGPPRSAPPSLPRTPAAQPRPPRSRSGRGSRRSAARCTWPESSPSRASRMRRFDS